MKLREPYEQFKSKIKTYDDLKKHFSKEVIFSKNEVVDIGEIKEQIILENEVYSRVWLLFGKKENCNWECLQVAQSKSNIENEIDTVIEFLLAEHNNLLKKVDYKNSAFYEEVCPNVDSKKYREYLYRKIREEYDCFCICLLNVDKYLGIVQEENEIKTDADKIVCICKNQYAEAKIAYQTLAVYWRLYSSGIDGQTITYIVENPTEFEE